MDILIKPITGFSFTDIEAFCQQKYREGIQLDYKKDIPKDGFSKHFASFSNTRGGVIIVGVEEDRTTGLPIAWDGISMRQGLVEKIHQDATHVEPLPAYEVHVTNDNGSDKAFVLIRVFEGDRTPYYVHNDSNIWIRTGNISNPIGLASPEAVELLFGKKEQAQRTRTNNDNRAELVFAAALKNAEVERQKKLAEDKQAYRIKYHAELQAGTAPPYKSGIYQNQLGDESTGMCVMSVQPYYPRKALTTPKEILDKRDQFKAQTNWYGSFPHIHPRPIPDGMFGFQWNERDGTLECEQVYANGMLYKTDDVLRVEQADDQRIKNVYISSVVSNLFEILKAANNMYTLFGYQGGIVGYVELRNMEGVLFRRLVPQGWHDPFGDLHENTPSLLSQYRWDFDLDTSILNDKTKFKEFFFEKIREIYWSLGYADVSDQLLEAFYTQL